LPPLALNGGFLASLLTLALVAYDWRTRGRLHPVTLIAGGGFILWAYVRLPFAKSGVWAALAEPLVALAQGR
jgi:hypothetical protein